MLLIGPVSREQLRVLGHVGGIGVELVVFTLLGYFGGRWLDREIGTTPWFQWVGLLIGLAAGAKSLYVLARNAKLDSDDSP